MRVIGGSAKGHKLVVPHGLKTRPTLDRVRTSLFDIIGKEIEHKKFLDLFAGSGANGIEALSRGAEKAWFIDISREAIECIISNLDKTRFKEKSIVIKGKIPNVLNRISESMDLIFMDPPYTFNDWEELFRSLYNSNIVNPTTQLIVEHGRFNIPPDNIPPFKLTRRERYGDTFLSFYC